MIHRHPEPGFIGLQGDVRHSIHRFARDVQRRDPFAELLVVEGRAVGTDEDGTVIAPPKATEQLVLADFQIDENP